LLSLRTSTDLKDATAASVTSRLPRSLM
jgi:hypothetical protein